MSKVTALEQLVAAIDDLTDALVRIAQLAEEELEPQEEENDA